LALPPKKKKFSDEKLSDEAIKKARRKRKKEKIMKRRQRERESKLAASQSAPKVATQLHKPTQKPSPRPSNIPAAKPSMPNPSKTSTSQTTDKQELNDLIFYVIGDAPYKVSELDPTTGFPQQVRGIPSDAEFVVHVGDVLSAKESECHLSWYQQVSFMLKASNAPVFITPGDNDWLGKYRDVALVPSHI
jgi:hypothetical protein